MGCGCGRNKPNNTPSRTINPTPVNQLPNTTNPSPATNNLNAANTNPTNAPRAMIDSDRIRIERLRREAIARARGTN
jgi:hypothetical protein